MGAKPIGSTPSEFAQFIAAEREKWAEVIKEANITIDGKPDRAAIRSAAPTEPFRWERDEQEETGTAALAPLVRGPRPAAFGHRSRIKQMGYGPEDYAGKPVIAIVNTWSDINQCHAHFKERVEDIKRGVFQAGGFPLELPAISLSEPFVKPTTMLYRNFLAMETEELLRSHPVDGAVLMGGCDKTTPGLIMGAISMNLPAIFVPAGAMLRGNYRGEVLGSGSDSWKYWADLQAGAITHAGLGRDRGRHRPLGRHVHDHGHGRDHDRDRGGHGLLLARCLLDPGTGRGPPAHVRGSRATDRGDGLGGPEAIRHHELRPASTIRSAPISPWAARPTL